MNEAEFLIEIQKLNIVLSEEQKDLLKEYANFLLEYNQHTNLTAIKTINEVYLKHFYDSLTLVKIIDLTKELKILDIGTGAGFPGLVLAICFPNITVHLLDSNQKKITFLNQVIQKLSLKNVKTIYQRVEDFAKDQIETYDIITSRAVAELRILLEISFSILKINGTFIAMKSSIEKEMQDSMDTIDILGGNLEEINSFELPKAAGKRNLIKIKKIKETPKEYPRRYSTILKKTLKKKYN